MYGKDFDNYLGMTDIYTYILYINIYTSTYTVSINYIQSLFPLSCACSMNMNMDMNINNYIRFRISEQTLNVHVVSNPI